MSTRENTSPQIEGKVPVDWLGRGIWLSKAPEIFADPFVVQQYRTHAERFASLRDGQTPAAYELESDLSGKDRDRELLGRLSGDALVAYRMCLRTWENMRMDLKNQLTFGHLVAFGARGTPDSDLMWIPVRAWFHLDVDEGNVVRGQGMAYWYVRVVRLGDTQEARPVVASVIAQPPKIASAVLPKAKRGPKGGLTERTTAAILADLRSGRLRLEDAKNEKQDVMALRYGVKSRDTVMKAFGLAVSQFTADPNSDK